MSKIPKTQQALQLVGPEKMAVNLEKEVFEPGPYQVLGKVNVVGLCFSDQKLLKQFSGHVRKSEVIAGVEAEALKDMPNYVPNDAPTVPGHEVVVTVVKAGDKVEKVKEGERYLVQADYRWLKTENSNGAFGYNFEGGLQEYTLFDERAIVSPEGDSMLMEADATLSASAVALVEPWACVEDSYVVKERQGILDDGKLLLVGGSADTGGAGSVHQLGGEPAEGAQAVASLDDIEDESMDDVIFFGADADLLEKVFYKIAKNGVINIVQGGKQFGRLVQTPVGRVHYGGIRITGTRGDNPEDGYAVIPATGEIREGDKIDVVGAGGPMGVMHVLRNICQGVPSISVAGGDLSPDRLEMLDQLAGPLAEQNGVSYSSYNPKEAGERDTQSFIALMVPVPALVAQAVVDISPGGIINIFAGIPATVYHDIDLDAYIKKQLYFIGTSGSDVNDMQIVLKKVEGRTLDTNLSVAAVSGLDGAIDGMEAVGNQAMPGKIIVYPDCKGLGLTALSDLEEKHPEVAACLDHGHWTKAAEDKLLELYTS